MLFLRRGVCSVPTQGRAFLPRHFCITPKVASSFLLFLLWPMLVHMVLPGAPYGHCVFWMACLCIWSLVPALPLSCSPPGALLQMAMTKDVFGGSRVIHGQNCPISDEISQKLDLYPDRLKSGVLCRPRPHIWGSPTPKFLKYFSLEVFPRLHTSRYKHTSVRTRPVRSEECIRLDSGWPQ